MAIKRLGGQLGWALNEHPSRQHMTRGRKQSKNTHYLQFNVFHLNILQKNDRGIVLTKTKRFSNVLSLQLIEKLPWVEEHENNREERA